MVDLKAFCDPASPLPWLSGGWTHLGFSYFTTGEVAVRVPALDGVPVEKSREAIQLAETLDRYIDPCLAWQRWPMFEMPAMLKKKCPTCQHVEAFAPTKPYVRFATATLDIRRLRLVLSLPRGEVCWGTSASAPVAFRFRDTLPNGVEYLGHGLIMPVENVDADRCVLASDVRRAA